MCFKERKVCKETCKCYKKKNNPKNKKHNEKQKLGGYYKPILIVTAAIAKLHRVLPPGQGSGPVYLSVRGDSSVDRGLGERVRIRLGAGLCQGGPLCLEGRDVALWLGGAREVGLLLGICFPWAAGLLVVSQHAGLGLALPAVPLAAGCCRRRSGPAGLGGGEAGRSLLRLGPTGFGTRGGRLGGSLPLGAGGANGGDEGRQGDVQYLQAGKVGLRAGAALRGRAGGQNLEAQGIEGDSRRAHLRGDIRVCQAQDVHCLHAQWRQGLQAGRAETLDARHAHLAYGDARHHAVDLGDSHGVGGGHATRLTEGAGSSVNHAHGGDGELHWPRLDGNEGGVGGQAGGDHLDAPNWYRAVGRLGLLLRVQGEVAEEVSLGSPLLGGVLRAPGQLLLWDLSVGRRHRHLRDAVRWRGGRADGGRALGENKTGVLTRWLPLSSRNKNASWLGGLPSRPFGE